MAIGYFSSGEGQGLMIGLSTDTKPVGPIDYLLFLETDTGVRWRSLGGIWVNANSPGNISNSDLGTGTANSSTFLRGDRTWATPSGSGDMVLASAQTNSGIKTFLDTTMKLRNVANTFDGYFVNTNTANRIYTLKDASGTIAFTSDITGTNSGTNTGDQTSIVGITGTKAQFNTAVTDGDIVYLDSVDAITGVKTMSGLNVILHSSSGLTIRNPADTFKYTLTAGAIAADRVLTLPLTAGTLALTSDITGTNSGTNTGDNAVNSLYSGLVSNATHTGDATGATALTIAAGVVTLAKMADMATTSLIYRKTAGTGVPEVNTLATLKTDLLLTGTNSGDQTSIVGITGTINQFNTALTDGDFATGGGTATGTNTGDQTLPVKATGAEVDTGTDDANFATAKAIADSIYQKAVYNQSVASQGAGFATDTYLTGSSISIPSGALKTGTRYKCIFNVTKTGAGTATPIINIRFGTNGSTADTSRGTLTWTAQTAVADEGVYEIWVTFRTVGSGTSAVIQSLGRLTHRLVATGFGNTAVSEPEIATSGGFDSTVANSIIGLSVNGGASAVWTVSLVQAELQNIN